MSGFVFTPLKREPEAEQFRFVPLDGDARGDGEFRFTPLDDEGAKPSVLKTVALNNPLTAVAETGANLATMGVALPVAGLAGLATEAAHAVGLTDKHGADVVHAVGDALTYQPRGELGQAATAAVMAPFEKLHEAATWAGEKTQDATGSPAAATAAHTLIEGVLPLAIGPAAKAGKAGVTKVKDAVKPAETPKAPAPETAGEFKFTPIEEVANAEAKPAVAREGRLAGDDPQMHGTESAQLETVRRSGDHGMPGVAGEFQFVPLRDGAGTDAAALARAAGRDEGILPRELRMDNPDATAEPARVVPEGEGRRTGSDGSAGGEIAGAAEPEFGTVPVHERPAARSAGEEALPQVDMADVPGRNPAAANVGEAGRTTPLRPMGSPDSIRDAFGESAAAGQVQQPRPARWALVEARDLKLQDKYSQPDWYAREKVTQEIVGEFNPNKLAEAMGDDAGAPIVGRDGAVEAGHKRAEALQRIYQANGQKAIDYRQFLKNHAADFGLKPEQVDGMKKPVLVRVPDESRPASADFSNTRNNGELAHSPKPENPVSGDVQKSHIGPETQAMAGEVQNSWVPGQNYIPLRDAMPVATEAPATAKSAKPIRREDVLKPFFKALDINPYWGRVKGNRLGYYMPKKEVLRVKNKSDLEVTAHEVFHALDDRIPAIRAAWRNDKELREQLKAVSYDKNSVAEGYAEAGRLFLTNPAELERVAPKAYAWLETFAETHPLGPALRDAQRGMVSWFEQSALDRAKSKIGDPTSLNNRGLLPFLSDKWQAMRKGFRQAVVDDLDGVRLAEMNLTGKLSPLGAYETARLSRAAGSITDGSIRFGFPVKKADDSFTYSGKGLEEILRPVAGRLDDFMTYAVGRSARELMQQGREHLFSPAEIRAAVALETPEFHTAWTEYQNFNRGVLDFAESFGILNAETRKLWKRQEYLPFWRVGQGVSGEGAVSGQWAGVKGLKGGTGNLREPLQNMVQNANALITAALKNDARARVVEMIEAERGGGKFMQKIPAEARPVKIDAKQVQDAVLKDMGIDDRAGLSAEGAKFAALVEKQIAEAPEFYQFFVGGQAPKGKNIVAVMKAGKPEYYEVADPLLLRALQAIDRPAQSWVIKLLGLPKKVGQASIVLDPTFAAANFSRDQMMAGIMTKSGFRPIIDAMDGMRHRMTTSPLYREWVANGGGMSSLFLDESAFRAKLEQFYSSQGVDYRTVIDSPKKLLGMIETFGDAFESATRIGSFKRSLEKGEHPRHAAYESREVSVDFSASGDLPAIRAAYDLVMFLRPTVVSLDRLYRGIANDPNRGVIAAKTAMLGLASAALYLMNRDNPRYADISDFLKDSHFHVFVGDHHFMIPRPFEPGAIGRVAELAVEKVVNEDADGLGKDLLRVIGNTFHLNLMPQIAAPLVEQYANKNSFTGAPIETPDHAGLQPFLRAKPGTSETMKAAGMLTRDMPEELQVNPVRAEALLRGYLNSWAAYGLLASDRLVVGKNQPEMRADEMPVVRRFYQSEPPKHTKFETSFYEMLSESKRLRGTMRELDDMGLREVADTKEQSPLAGEAKPLERAAKNLQGINRDMEQVRQDGNLNPRQKRERLDALTVERNALLKDAVQASKAAQKASTAADMAKRGINVEK
jgi:hypothetical protein